MVRYLIILIGLFMFFKSQGQIKPDPDKLEKIVVVIKCFDYNNNFIGHGSGVILDSKGTCITNYHVLKDAYYARILTQIGEEYNLDKIISESEDCDLLKFTIKNPYNKQFVGAVISPVAARKNDDVWAMGTPDDIQNMNQITHGGITNIFKIKNIKILQTDAKIAHGSSGGGLFNAKGDLVGITGGKFKGEDATLAGRNIAISISEISKLMPVYKDRLTNYTIPQSTQPYVPPSNSYIPPRSSEKEYTEVTFGTVSFYDDWKYPFEISIEGRYGSTKTKFTGVPRCGDEGTAKFRLPPGTYSYKATTYGYVLLSQVTYNYSGYVTVVANDCKLIKLTSPQKKVEEVSTRNLVLGTNFVHSIFLNKYFSNQKYRTNVFLCKSLFQSYEGIKYSGVTKTGFDIERVFSTKNRVFDINFSIGPSIRYQFGTFDNLIRRDFNSSTKKWENTTEKVNVDNVFYNVRFGTELIFGDRIVVHGNIGYGYSTQSWGMVGYPGNTNTYLSHENMDYEIYVGYKFGSSESLFLKYSPQLILPGWADYKRTYGKKGKFKMGIFLTSAATAYFANRYYLKEYEKYRMDPQHDPVNYRNANLANKVTMVSAGLAGSVYLYDAIHFFTKVKSLK